MTLVEAWCPRCRVTYPPEAKLCIHCGGRVVAGRPDALASGATRLSEVAPTGPAPADEDAHDAGPQRPSGLRLNLAIWLVLVIAGTILRQCTER